MLDHFFRTHRLSRLKSYHKSKDLHKDNLESLKLRERELLLIQALIEQKIGSKIPTKFGQAHSLAEIRNVVTSKRRRIK